MKLKIFVAVACFLPGRAKDLSALLYVQGYYIIWQTHRFEILDSQLLRKYLPETADMSDC